MTSPGCQQRNLKHRPSIRPSASGRSGGGGEGGEPQVVGSQGVCGWWQLRACAGITSGFGAMKHLPGSGSNGGGEEAIALASHRFQYSSKSFVLNRGEVRPHVSTKAKQVTSRSTSTMTSSRWREQLKARYIPEFRMFPSAIAPFLSRLPSMWSHSSHIGSHSKSLPHVND